MSVPIFLPVGKGKEKKEEETINGSRYSCNCKCSWASKVRQAFRFYKGRTTAR
jgi:hypothetical protein